MNAIPADAGGQKLRVLVLEDEWVSRNFLVELIETSGLGEVAGAVGDLDEAAELLASARAFDVVFVDVNLAGSVRDGLSLIRERAGVGAPMFVLATAMREHALEAYDLGVADYITKPFSQARVTQCLERLAAKHAPRVASPRRVVARKRRSLVFLEIDDIWAFESSDRLTTVHSAHGAFDIDLSLAAVELSFGRMFIRAHRNWLVSAAHIRELERDAGESTLVVGGGYTEKDPCVRVPVARERAQAIRDHLVTSFPGVRRR